MSNKFYNALEKNLMPEMKSTTDDEFERVKEMYDNSGLPTTQMPVADHALFKKLMPDTDLELVKDSRVMSVGEGVCSCGRTLSIVDIVKKSFDTNSHSGAFLGSVFRGEMGKVVVCATDISEEFRSKMPATTMWVEETSPIPCINCGKEHDLCLLQENLMHFWTNW